MSEVTSVPTEPQLLPIKSLICLIDVFMKNVVKFRNCYELYEIFQWSKYPPVELKFQNGQILLKLSKQVMLVKKGQLAADLFRNV